MTKDKDLIYKSMKKIQFTSEVAHVSNNNTNGIIGHVYICMIPINKRHTTEFYN